jgi:HD-GYP domain-containing protein (c-di-GMP phosphodiesterase class II)
MLHPVLGERILAPMLGQDHPILAVVRWHHERVDGRGGPDGLMGDVIPLGARIVSVADAFDAMTTKRPYRRPLCLDRAIAELEIHAGLQFDPICVGALEVLGSPTLGDHYLAA